LDEHIGQGQALNVKLSSINELPSIVMLIAILFSAASAAEVINIPVGQQAPEKQNLPRPFRGMSADSVLDQFGLPESKSGPVGDPPISIWRYPGYSVYFESETVIHSVLTHTPQVPLDELE
jgi:hypothetical protein